MTLHWLSLSTQVASKIMYIKIRHIYTTNVQRNAYILTIWPFNIVLPVNKSDYFGFMLNYFVWFLDNGPLGTKTCRNVKCDIIM